MINRHRNPMEFLLGMVLFFLWEWFAVMALGASFRSDNALGVFVCFGVGAICNAVAYWGLHIATNGIED